jgi:thiamine transport system permease protein
VERRYRLVKPTPRWPGAVVWTIAAAVPLAFLALFFIWPVLTLIAFGTGYPPLSLEPFFDMLSRSRSWQVIWQTLAQATAGTALSLVLGVPFAFVLYRLEFRGRMLLRGLATVPFVLPSIVVGVAFTALYGPSGPLNFLGLDRTFMIIVLAFAFFNVTVVLRTVGGFWAQLDTRPEQAAAMLGASPVRVFLTITLPRLTPAITSAAALVFLFCATSFAVVLVLGGPEFANIETEIYRLAVGFLDLSGAAVLGIVQFVIVAAVLVVSSRLRRRREQAVSMQFNQSRGIRPTRKHLPVIAVVGLTAAGLHVLPLVTLVARSLRDGQGRFSFENYANLVNTPDSVQLSGTVLDAVGLSLWFAVLATLIALTLGMLVVLVASRRPRSLALRRGIEVFDGAMMLPIGVSAVTLGFGLLLTMHQPLGIGIDLRSSVVLIPIAQALIALPLVMRALLPTLRGLDNKQREAAALLGASPLRVLRTIDLRILARPMGLAVGFAFATSLGEFGASSFLVRPEAQTLPVLIGRLIGRQGVENYGMALAASVLLAAITATVMLLAERARTDVGGEL